MKHLLLYTFSVFLLTLCNKHGINTSANQPYVCSGGVPYNSLSIKEQLHKKLKISDTSKTFLLVKLIVEDDKGESNASYTNVRFVNKQGDTISTMTDLTGEFNILVESGKQSLMIDYLPIYKVDTNINLSSNSVINLIVKINIFKKNIYYLDVKPKEYSILDAVSYKK